MPCLPQPQAAVPIDLRLVHVVVAAEARLRRDEVELGHDLERVPQRPCHVADLPAEPAQDAVNFPLLGRFQDLPFGTEARDAGRLDEDRFARAAGTMYDPLQLVAVIDRHGQHIVIAADRGVRIAQNLTQLGIAEKAFDLVLDALIDFHQLLANLGQLALILRGRYLADVISYNRVRGLPFRAAELAGVIQDVISNV